MDRTPENTGARMSAPSHTHVRAPTVCGIGNQYRRLGATVAADYVTRRRWLELDAYVGSAATVRSSVYHTSRPRRQRPSVTPRLRRTAGHMGVRRKLLIYGRFWRIGKTLRISASIVNASGVREGHGHVWTPDSLASANAIGSWRQVGPCLAPLPSRGSIGVNVSPIRARDMKRFSWLSQTQG